MKPNKGHVAAIDVMIEQYCGIRRYGWFTRVFSSFEKYNRLVAGKYSRLDSKQKDTLEKIRKKLDRRTAKTRQVIATARSRARRGK